MTSPWQPLSEEINRWDETGLTPTFWWRDDDAAKPGPKLQKLARISSEIPICLAVVPDWLDEGLAPWLNKNFPNSTVLQHGWAHQNHADIGYKKSEFGLERHLDEAMAEIAKGHHLLSRIFTSRYQAVFVPPWNRIDIDIIKNLTKFGPSALSTYGASFINPSFIPRLNTHVDIINWKEGREFIGFEKAIALCVDHLKAKRLGKNQIHPMEPTGILTHHIDHDNGCWEFLDALNQFSTQHTSLRWLTPEDFLNDF